MADDPTAKRSSGGENDRIKYGASCMQGGRDDMQDAHTTILELDGSDITSFFGVFDGHGGKTIALYCSEQLHIELVNDPDYVNNLPTAMRNVYFRIDEALRRTYKGLKPESSGLGKLLRCLCISCKKKEPFFGAQRKVSEGTTACVALIRGNQITVGNAGDSRCVLSKSGQAIDLSTDHKPESAVERRRIEAAGGQVIQQQIPRMRNGRLVVESGLPRIDGGIAISRALGDFEYKQNKTKTPEEQKMTCNPDIHTESITDDIDFLLIASDGIWSVRSSEEVVGFVNQEFRSGATNLSRICEELLDWSMRSGDNSTVILVQFKLNGRICSSIASRPPASDPAAAGSTSASCTQPQDDDNPTATDSTSSESKADTNTEIEE